MRAERKCVCVSIVWLCICMGGLSVAGPTPGGDREAAEMILNAMLESGKKIYNVRCKVECLTRYGEIMRQVQYEQRLKAGQSEREALKGKREYVFYRYDFAFDDKGRFRVEELQGTGDAQGRLLATDLVDTVAWDGKTSMKLYEKFVNIGSIGSSQPLRVTLDSSEPGAMFRGMFLRILRGALQREDEVRVRRDSDTYHIEVMREGSRRAIAVVEPRQGYAVTDLQAFGKEGGILYACQAKYREVSPGIWYPVEGVKYSGPPERPGAKHSVKVTHIAVNDPNLDDRAFCIDFPKGTQVYDRRTGLNYVVDEPLSQSVSGQSGSLSVGEVAARELERIARESDGDSALEVRELLVPTADLALQGNKPFVLDLFSCELIDPSARLASEQSQKYLQKAGKGDLAWDGRLVATRGGELLTHKQEAERPLTYVAGEWVRSYELPKEVELPYQVLVVTKEDAHYLMSVRKIADEGITVAYRKLGADEVDRSVPESKGSPEQ